MEILNIWISGEAKGRCTMPKNTNIEPAGLLQSGHLNIIYSQHQALPAAAFLLDAVWFVHRELFKFFCTLPFSLCRCQNIMFTKEESRAAIWTQVQQT